MAGNEQREGGRSSIRRRMGLWAAVVALLLLVPLVAMQFTDEVKWGVFDFVFAGALLFGAALSYELIAKKGGTIAYRAAVAVAVATALLLVWVNAAVGIIGDDESFNAMYFGVLAVGAIGALLARFRPEGMARTLAATAIAQMLVPSIVLAIPGLRGVLVEPPGAGAVFALNAVFAALWLLSAWLFWKAARS